MPGFLAANRRGMSLSDNATLLTIPGLRSGHAPGPDEIGRAVARASRSDFPRLPTSHGFCTLMTRAALDRIGGFDPAFGRGYSEENDWSMRALRAGLEIACADGAFVSHFGEASFGQSSEATSLRKRNFDLLTARWPGYLTGTQQWCQRNPLREIFERIRREIAITVPGALPRLLLVGYRYGQPGGIEEHIRLMLPHLVRTFDTTVLALRRLGGVFSDAAEDVDPSGARIVYARAESIRPDRRLLGIAASCRNEASEHFFEAMVAGGRYDVVHFHSLVDWGTFELPAIARRHGSRVAFSIHDQFLNCPDYNMIGPDGHPCRKARASPDDAECLRCLATKEQLRLGASPPPPIPDLLRERIDVVTRMVRTIDRIVAPSRFAMGECAKLSPDAAGRTTVIPHGVAFSSRLPFPPRSSTLRVAFIGRVCVRKGVGVVLAAASQLIDEMIEFSLHGQVDAGLPQWHRKAQVRFLGPYKNEDLPRLLANTDLVVVPSIFEEVFCLTLSEAMALGIPVAASPIGAIAERLEEGRTGFAFPSGDVDALVRLLRKLSRSLSTLEATRLNLARLPTRTTAMSAADYVKLYQELIGMPRVEAAHEIKPPLDGAGSRSWLEALRLVEGPAPQEPFTRAATAAQLPVRVLVRVRPGSEELLERTLQSLAPVASSQVDVVALAGKAVPSPKHRLAKTIPWIDAADARTHIPDNHDAAVLALESGDEVDPGLIGECTRVLATDPASDLVAFDDDRLTIGRERYGERLHAGINPAAIATGERLGRAVVRASVVARAGVELPFECGPLALLLRKEKGPAAIRHLPTTLCHLADALPEHERQAAAPAAQVSLGKLAVIVYCDELRAAQPDAARRWSNPSWEGRVQITLLEAAGDEATIFNGYGGTPGAVQRVDRGQHDLNSRLDRVIAELRADTVIVQSDRISWPDLDSPSRLLATLGFAGVALACPTIVLPDGRIHHAGYVLGAGPAGIAGNLLEGRSWGEPLPVSFDSPRRDVSSASGLVFAIRRDAWLQDSRRDAVMTYEMAMVERCLRLADSGKRIVACLDAPALLGPPLAAPMEAPASPTIRSAFLDRWLVRLAHDPFHHPRLALNPPWQKGILLVAPWAARPATARKIVAFPFDDWGSGHYRVRGPLAALSHAGHVEAAIMPGHATGRAPTIAEMARLDPDTILLHNFLHDYQLEALADYARHLDRLRVFSLDDLLTALPPANPYSRTIYRDIEQRVRRALTASDRLVVTTQKLAETFAPLCRDVRVIPNRLERKRWGGLTVAKRPAGTRPRFGWAGARQHDGDLAWLKPVLRATRDRVDWVFFGMCPDNLRPYALECHPMVPFQEYPARLASLAFDVAIAPLEENPFNEAKSSLRLLEYGILGLQVIATTAHPTATLQYGVCRTIPRPGSRKSGRPPPIRRRWRPKARPCTTGCSPMGSWKIIWTDGGPHSSHRGVFLHEARIFAPVGL